MYFAYVNMHLSNYPRKWQKPEVSLRLEELAVSLLSKFIDQSSSDRKEKMGREHQPISFQNGYIITHGRKLI